MPNNPMPTDERLQGFGGAAPPSVQYGGQPGYAPLSYASLNMLRGLVGQPSGGLFSGGLSSGGQPPMAMDPRVMDPRVIQAQAAAQQQALSQVGNAGRPRYTSYPPIGGVGAP